MIDFWNLFPAGDDYTEEEVEIANRWAWIINEAQYALRGRRECTLAAEARIVEISDDMFRFLGLTPEGLRGVVDGLIEFVIHEYPVIAANAAWFRCNACNVFYHNPRNPELYNYQNLKYMAQIEFEQSRKRGINLRKRGAEQIKKERAARAAERAKNAAQANLAAQSVTQNTCVGFSR